MWIYIYIYIHTRNVKWRNTSPDCNSFVAFFTVSSPSVSSCALLTLQLTLTFIKTSTARSLADRLLRPVCCPLWESILATQMWSAGAGMENRYRTQDEENLTARNSNESWVRPVLWTCEVNEKRKKKGGQKITMKKQIQIIKKFRNTHQT